jgi:hypothetical protein
MIPRCTGDMVGGRVFASERGVLTNYYAVRDALAVEARKRMVIAMKDGQ